jgi:hypothetical protein
MQGRAKQFEAELAVFVRSAQVGAELAEQRGFVGSVLEHGPDGKRMVLNRYAKELGLIDGLRERRDMLGQGINRVRVDDPITLGQEFDAVKDAFSHPQVHFPPEFGGGEVAYGGGMPDLDDVRERPRVG